MWWFEGGVAERQCHGRQCFVTELTRVTERISIGYRRYGTRPVLATKSPVHYWHQGRGQARYVLKEKEAESRSSFTGGARRCLPCGQLE